MMLVILNYTLSYAYNNCVDPDIEKERTYHLICHLFYFWYARIFFSEAGHLVIDKWICSIEDW